MAKLATGEMAFDDVWWGGKVKNPWNIAEGSSGSSAGPAAAVTAGCVAFAVNSLPCVLGFVPMWFGINLLRQLVLHMHVASQCLTVLCSATVGHACLHLAGYLPGHASL